MVGQLPNLEGRGAYVRLILLRRVRNERWNVKDNNDGYSLAEIPLIWHVSFRPQREIRPYSHFHIIKTSGLSWKRIWRLNERTKQGSINGSYYSWTTVSWANGECPYRKHDGHAFRRH